MRSLILWHILGSYFLLIWGVGVVEVVFTKGPSIEEQVIDKNELPRRLTLWNRVWGRACDEAEISEEKCLCAE